MKLCPACGQEINGKINGPYHVTLATPKFNYARSRHGILIHHVRCMHVHWSSAAKAHHVSISFECAGQVFDHTVIFGKTVRELMANQRDGKYIFQTWTYNGQRPHECPECKKRVAQYGRRVPRGTRKSGYTKRPWTRKKRALHFRARTQAPDTVLSGDSERPVIGIGSYGPKLILKEVHGEKDLCDRQGCTNKWYAGRLMPWGYVNLCPVHCEEVDRDRDLALHQARYTKHGT